MEQCWAAEPSERPLLGFVQPQLEAIYHDAVKEESEGKSLSFSYRSEPPHMLMRFEKSSDIYNNYYDFNFREF